MPQKIVTQFSGPSCSGKSRIAELLAQKFPDIYLVSYDRQKWFLSGYDRDQHASLIAEITLGLFEVVCKTGSPIQLENVFSNEEEYKAYRQIAEKYQYRFLHFAFTAPNDVLLTRFRERLEDVKKTGRKISVKSEDVFIKNLSGESFIPEGIPTFDTSVVSETQILDEITTSIAQKEK